MTLRERVRRLHDEGRVATARHEPARAAALFYDAYLLAKEDGNRLAVDHCLWHHAGELRAAGEFRAACEALSGLLGEGPGSEEPCDYLCGGTITRTSLRFLAHLEYVLAGVHCPLPRAVMEKKISGLSELAILVDQGDPEAQARISATIVTAHYRFFVGDYREAERICRTTHSEVRESSLANKLLYRAGLAAALAGNRNEGLRLACEYRDLSPEGASLWQYFLVRSVVSRLEEHYQAGRDCAEMAEYRGPDLHSTDNRFFVPFLLAEAFIFGDEPDDIPGGMRKVREACRRTSVRETFLYVLLLADRHIAEARRIEGLRTVDPRFGKWRKREKWTFVDPGVRLALAKARACLPLAREMALVLDEADGGTAWSDSVAAREARIPARG